MSVCRMGKVPMCVEERRQSIPLDVDDKQKTLPMCVEPMRQGARGLPAISGIVDTPENLPDAAEHWLENWLVKDATDIYGTEMALFSARAVSGDQKAWEYIGSIKGDDGFSPVVTVEEIEGGHRVTITDATGDHVFDVMDGSDPSAGGIFVTDSQGNSWYIPKGEGSGDDPVILDEDGVAWHLLPGSGGEGEINVTDGNGNEWHFAKDDEGGGTSDYNNLTNKPTLNGVEIIGDKISEDYKLPPPMWFGTRTEYNALPVIYPDICYFIEEGT